MYSYKLFILCIFTVICAPQVQAEPAWRGSLSEIRSVAAALAEENQMLLDEYNDLDAQWQQVSDKTAEVRQQIQDLTAQLEDRKDALRSNRDVKALEDTIREREKAMLLMKKELMDLNGQMAAIQKKRDLKALKIADLELAKSKQELAGDLNPVQPMVVEPTEVKAETLEDLRAQIEAAHLKERQLQEEIEAMKSGAVSPRNQVEAIQKDNRQLEAEIATLQKQLSRQKTADKVFSPEQMRLNDRYQVLLKEKLAKESEISKLESRLRSLQSPDEADAAGAAQNQSLVQDVAALDERNEGLRARLDNMKQNIVILTDQIDRLQNQYTLLDKVKQKKTEGGPRDRWFR